MVMLVIMVMGISAVLIGSLGANRLKIARQGATSNALAQAKEALVSYAATYGDTHAGQVHGYLPCPDIDVSNGEGSSKLSCGSKNVSSIGRLPWKTLELATLRDGDGECLWYAVSGTYKNNTKTDLMNWDNSGLFEILDAGGATIARNVAAVVFAPGAVLGGQSRAPDGTAPVCGGNYTADNYLDNTVVSGVANALSQFRLGASAQMNDQMIFITKDDIFNAIMRRADFTDPARNPLRLMTRKAAECIADYGRRNAAGYGDKRLPWAGRLWTAPGDYWSDCNYMDGSSLAPLLYGRLPNRVSGSRSSTNGSNNIISQSTCLGTSSYYQLKSDGSGCPSVTDWNKYYPWWTNWKDHVFYSLASSYRPATANFPLTSCGTCLAVNGSGPYAAIVAFAGKKLSGQARATDADRLDFINYLEGLNFVTSLPSNTLGNGNHQSGAETDGFNDVLYCIKPDLTVTSC